MAYTELETVPEISAAPWALEPAGGIAVSFHSARQEMVSICGALLEAAVEKED